MGWARVWKRPPPKGDAAREADAGNIYRRAALCGAHRLCAKGRGNSDRASARVGVNTLLILCGYRARQVPITPRE